MVTALQIARQIRRPGSVTPRGAGSPPVFMTLPTTVARKAVKTYHEHGVTAARDYLRASKLDAWARHRNPSMASGARNVIDGIEAYFAADRADGRPRRRSLRRPPYGSPPVPLKF